MMKRLFALLAVFCMLGLLAGCAAATAKDPVWQAELSGGGTISLSGCSVHEETADFFDIAVDIPLTVPLLHLTGEHAPTLTLTGVEESEVIFLFAEPQADGTWLRYEAHIPEAKLDYVLTKGKNGTLNYRLDTVYSYGIAIGSELWLLDVDRDGL